MKNSVNRIGGVEKRLCNDVWGKEEKDDKREDMIMSGA